MTLDDVDAFAKSLAGVTVNARYGNRTWLVGDKFFAWQRPFSKAASFFCQVRASPGYYSAQ